MTRVQDVMSVVAPALCANSITRARRRYGLRSRGVLPRVREAAAAIAEVERRQSVLGLRYWSGRLM